jgi:hypothetical protein
VTVAELIAKLEQLPLSADVVTEAGADSRDGYLCLVDAENLVRRVVFVFADERGRPVGRT